MVGDRRIWTLFLLVSVLSFGLMSLQFVYFARADVSFVELPVMSVTVVGVNGTQVVLNETDVAGLPFYRGYGGYKNQLGILKGLGNYSGVSLNILCNLVGVLTNASVVRVMAADNYSMTFTYAEVNGEFVTYDNVTGEEIPRGQPLVPIVAYYFNDTAFASSDGPLRMAIVGPEGLVTNSTYWVKQVVRIEVVDETVPEYSPLMALPLLFLATLVVAFCSKSRLRR
jgi:hypothetical protein